MHFHKFWFIYKQLRRHHFNQENEPSEFFSCPFTILPSCNVLPLTLHPQANTGLLSGTIYQFTSSRILYEWNNTICTFLPGFFYSTFYFEIHPCYNMYQQFICFYCWILFLFMNIPHLFIHYLLLDICVVCSFGLMEIKLL